MRVKSWKCLVVRLWVVIVVVCGVARLRLFNFLWVAFRSRVWSLAFLNNSSAVCVITLYFYMHLTLDAITITNTSFHFYLLHSTQQCERGSGVEYFKCVHFASLKHNNKCCANKRERR